MKPLILIVLLSGCSMIEPKWVVIGEGVNMLSTPEPHLDCMRYFKMYSTFTHWERRGCHTIIGSQHYIIVKTGDEVAYEHEQKHVREGAWHK